MEAILSQNLSDPDRALTALIEAANAAGGHDNITVAIGAVRDAASSAGAKAESITVPEADEDAADLEMYILETLFQNDSPSSEAPEATTDKMAIRPPKS